uniref:Ribosomal protein L29 n=1 Tax=Lophocladia kuetzingii TaxID=675577 RepID=A0A1Z1MPJ9_9FLOR|nr:ribosomal protein L29 [Lophocladia kuetzingii]ARW67705.1 ribosomal protein L29 [Lophocladia kuetzingii]
MKKMIKHKNKKLEYSEKNKEVSELKKELIFLRIKKATKQNIKSHEIKKIKYKVSEVLRSMNLKK